MDQFNRFKLAATFNDSRFNAVFFYWLKLIIGIYVYVSCKAIECRVLVCEQTS